MFFIFHVLCAECHGLSRPMTICLFWLIPQRKNGGSSLRSQRTNRSLSVSSTKRYDCFRLFVPSRYKYWPKLTITPQATLVIKAATEDTSIVAGNINGEKKSIPIAKGTDIVIDILGTHYNRTYLVFSWWFIHWWWNVSPNNKPFQLVTGMTHIHSTLHVFSENGLVTPLCLLVLVRNFFFFSPFIICTFFIIKICRSPCVHWTKVCGFYCPFQPKFFLNFIYHFFLFNFQGSPKLKSQQY